MKMRCTHCGEYFPKEGMYRTSGLTKACSPTCLAALYRKPPSRQRLSTNERRTDGEVPLPVRRAVYRRDGHACRFCGRQSSLHIHHIVYRSQGGEHEESNLITLCTEHHALVHANKQRYMPLLRGVLWMQYAESKRLSVPQVERWLYGRHQ